MPRLFYALADDLASPRRWEPYRNISKTASSVATSRGGLSSGAPPATRDCSEPWRRSIGSREATTKRVSAPPSATGR